MVLWKVYCVCYYCNFASSSCVCAVVQTCPYLLLLCRCAAQQHVQQNVRQQVDGDLVVVFDDETATGEHLTGQLMPHLENHKTSS